MNNSAITENAVSEFEGFLVKEERGKATIEKYIREVRLFRQWLCNRALAKEAVIEWKEYLQKEGYAPVTVNAKLSALNSFFSFMGWTEFRVKFLRIQRRMFRERSKELTKEEFERLVATAQKEGKERLMLLMETICATGIRVSELPYITVEAAKAGRAEIDLKGKIRFIMLPEKLCRKVLKYAAEKNISTGEIFLTRNGTSLSRRQIWREMKELCEKAGVESTKVFPHNLRHLFATAFYKICKDIVKLADMLGHSSIETTRIYLLTSGEEHARQLEMMKMIM
ncbi:MAG: tyrosine-type recombinase/integrase [Lachnospiraceae bacterium]|nr:tyrosine-type recombinase/integrase [Lachnospiraceae bacterium]